MCVVSLTNIFDSDIGFQVLQVLVIMEATYSIKPQDLWLDEDMNQELSAIRICLLLTDTLLIYDYFDTVTRLLRKKILKGPSELNAENLGAQHMK